MKNEIETIIKTDGATLSISEWDDGGAWVSLMHRHGSTYISLTRAEAEQLLAGLQEILAKGGVVLTDGCYRVTKEKIK